MSVQFQNKAAKAVKRNNAPQQSSVNEQNESNNYADMINENETAQFALIDKEKLNSETITDTGSVVQELKAYDKYKSIQEIIQHAIREDFPNKKSTYKVKSIR